MTNERSYGSYERTSYVKEHSHHPPSATYVRSFPCQLNIAAISMLLRSGCHVHPALPSGAFRLRATRLVPRPPSQHRVTRASGGAEPLPVPRRAALAAAAASCSAALLSSLAARCAFEFGGCVVVCNALPAVSAPCCCGHCWPHCLQVCPRLSAPLAQLHHAPAGV